MRTVPKSGFYTVWDLAPFRDLEAPPSEDAIRQWSCTRALDRDGPLPPVLVVRAGKDGARLNAGTDAFVSRALARNLDVAIHNHGTGQHGFDIRDDDPRSRQIIEAALDFFSYTLG